MCRSSKNAPEDTRIADQNLSDTAEKPSLGARFLLLLLTGYRLFFSAWLGNGCRFYPTCSAYATEAVKTHGAWRGSYLSAWRLLRCHPWCAGGFDPVPAHKGASFSKEK